MLKSINQALGLKPVFHTFFMILEDQEQPLLITPISPFSRLNVMVLGRQTVSGVISNLILTLVRV